MGVRDQLDGYRALAINDNGKLSLHSRRRKSFNRQYRYIFDALHDLPKNSVVDDEVVALDDTGRPNFNFLQHSKSQATRICYFVFDLLVYQNRDLTRVPLRASFAPPGISAPQAPGGRRVPFWFGLGLAHSRFLSVLAPIVHASYFYLRFTWGVQRETQTTGNPNTQ